MPEYALFQFYNFGDIPIGDIFYVPIEDLTEIDDTQINDMERYVKISDNLAQSFDDKDKVKTFVIETTVWSELE